MSGASQTYTVSTDQSVKMLQAMVGIGIICALLIVLTFEGTKSRIENNKAEALEQAIFKVIPGMVKKVTYQFDEVDAFTSDIKPESSEPLFYAGYDQKDNLVGIAIEAFDFGFADIIRILYGYDPVKEEIVGFYVLESKETPGLGDKIEKDLNFLSNFKALDASLLENKSALKNKIVTVKAGTKSNPWEIDGITGATISSRAIGKIIANSSEIWVPRIFNNKEIFNQLNMNNTSE